MCYSKSASMDDKINFFHKKAIKFFILSKSVLPLHSLKVHPITVG